MEDWEKQRNELEQHYDRIIREYSEKLEKNLYEDIKQKLLSEGYIEPKEKRWVRPKREEIEEHFLKKFEGFSFNWLPVEKDQHAKGEAKKFFDYWDSLDWKSNNTRIKSWRGRAATWISKYEKNRRNTAKNFIRQSAADKTAARIAERNR